MDVRQIKASVLLPIYNAKKYLEEAIESVLSQSFDDFELLLLNDGSSDGSELIIDYFVKKDCRCRKLSWSNRGLIETLNEGLRQARGDIIFRMDADDICLPERFEKQWSFLQQYPDCVALGSKVLLIDESGLPITEFPVLESHEEIDFENLKGLGSVITHPTVSMRKEAVLKVGGYRKNYKHAEDLDLFLRLAEVGRLANLPDILLEYRQHVSSIGYSKRKEQLDSAYKAVSDAKKRRGLIDNELTYPITLFKTPKLEDVYRKWAWWAISGGYINTARKYAFKAIFCDPLNVNNIKLIYCIVRGY